MVGKYILLVCTKGKYSSNIFNNSNVGLYNADEAISRFIIFDSALVSKVSFKYFNYDTPSPLTKRFTLKRFEFLDTQLQILDFLKVNNLLQEIGELWVVDSIKWYRRLAKFLFRNRLII